MNDLGIGSGMAYEYVISEKKSAAPKEDDGAISMEDCINEQVINELKAVDINTLSPFECMSFLVDLKKRLQ